MGPMRSTQCRRYEGGGGVPPLTAAYAPISVYSKHCFGTLLNDKTTHNDGKMNQYVQT